MALKLGITRQARRDLDKLLSYIAKEDRHAADGMRLRLDKALRLLTEKPFMGPAAPGFGDDALRKFTVAPYIVFYRPESQKLNVVRVLHSSMDLTQPDALQRKP